MSDNKATATTKAAEAKPETKSEKKRTVLTDAQRIAKLEADLKAAREKAEAKANKARTEASEKRAKLVAKRDELNKQIAELDKVIDSAPTAVSVKEG